MKHIFTLATFFWRHERQTLLRGLLFSITVLIAGIALLGLSGWFVVAAAIAGVSGIGITFDVFRPSAGVRFLALSRAAARYAERLQTHDATLKVLARLRVQILRHLSRADFATMIRLRGEKLLNRMTSDIDALDGLVIRLIFPVLSGVFVFGLSFLALWFLVDGIFALFVIVTLGITTWVVFIWLGAKTYRASKEVSHHLQILRELSVDHLRGRAVLAFAGRLEDSFDRLLHADQAARSAALRVARKEALAGSALELANVFVCTGALVIVASWALFDDITPARAALGFFATLALFEIVAPLRRGVAEIGQMRDAAGRIAKFTAPIDHEPPNDLTSLSKNFSGLKVESLRVAVSARTLLLEPITFQVAAGETMAIVGKSGVGKSTILNTIAGLCPPRGGAILLNGRRLLELSEYEVRKIVGYLPQRSALLSGSIRDAVTLGIDAKDEEISDILNIVALSEVVAQKGGLEAQLGEGGAGLSGGQRKRLALARVLLRKPDLLLLDEVSEGLDADTAQYVLRAIRKKLPSTSILMAAHRDMELEFADHVVSLKVASTA